MVFTVLWVVILGAIIVFYTKFCKRIPILMYHRIATVPGERNSLPPEKFKEQLDYLQQHGYNPITLIDLYKHYSHQVPLPPKPVILTFDDGYEDNYLTALPLLRERNMRATVFPIANWVGKENKWENFNHQLTRTMNWNQLKAWRAAGMEIGSHTLEHPFLTQCDETRLDKEFRDSKAILQENLGSTIEFLCYPYGFFDDKTIHAARKNGYKGALAIYDNAPLWRQDLFALPRIPIPSKQPLWEFALKVSRFHIVFILLRKLERSGKRLFCKF
ncbi:polysaccharide deacetylase family protein [Sporomusa sphaeroides DSM 2875]|uniref:polysaccharide deacetylase family protein n=1 Tax=Sporomusa sphaeroides TaxID=47679 RepID=UPI00202EF7A7|nr:polysaccharide deacetylase family protein [Sporomusa sphaeroides]MCM0758014.1 polysaccharide deacetylase family protein [Sporomusa sphaeroides DSM 2875]